MCRGENKDALNEEPQPAAVFDFILVLSHFLEVTISLQDTFVLNLFYCVSLLSVWRFNTLLKGTLKAAFREERSFSHLHYPSCSGGSDIKSSINGFLSHFLVFKGSHRWGRQ